MTGAQTDYTKVCFVIMPFGKKKVGDKQVDFDTVYGQVFAPAISETILPEGGSLEPRRTDQDFFSGHITVEMFAYLEYSRFALADISGLNANVFYELGVRHRAHQAGTAIFRQTGSPIPFDITSIKAFDYEYEPVEQAEKSRELITRVLMESLAYNRLDSPVQVALAAQRARATQPGRTDNLETLLRDAENAIRAQKWQEAIARYREAIRLDPANFGLRLKLGLFLKDRGDWEGALSEFTAAVDASPRYADALREKGIAENKLYLKRNQPAGMPTGEESLRQAISLNPVDYDALASLGGILKRQRRFPEALAQYREATRVSRGHSYPLLNELVLRGRQEGKLALGEDYRFFLARAERSLRAQVADHPPINAPWSCFDLSLILLLEGKKDKSLRTLDEGLFSCIAAWQPETYRHTLQLLVEGGVQLQGLDEALAKLDKAANLLAMSEPAPPG
jgi:tetratricopeptide (TPR) repeat protein